MAARQTWCQVWEEPVHDRISVRATAASEGSGLAVRLGGGRSREFGGGSVLLWSPSSSLKDAFFPIWLLAPQSLGQV